MMTVRLTHINLDGFSFPSENFESFSCAQLKKLTFHGRHAVTVVKQLQGIYPIRTYPSPHVVPLDNIITKMLL